MAESEKAELLIVDDEKNIRRTLRMILESDHIVVRDCGSAEEAQRLLSEQRTDLVLLDIKLPGMDGVQLLEKIRKEQPGVEVIMISGHATIGEAVRATQLGAYDFLEKPLDRERVVLSVSNCLEKVALTRKVRALLSEVAREIEIIGQSRAVQNMLEEIRKVAPTNGRVLITGESGTGKELVARAIHRLSKRAQGPFVKVNCAAIPAELIESELFGYEKGAFTGAAARKKGQFELAHEGTLFLDEIGDMSQNAQAKVLRVLQTGELSHVGGEQTLKVDVRVIAATNRDLRKAVAEGAFREDLYFRLNVIPIHCAPLRERADDVPLLLAKFVKDFCRENGFKEKEIDPAVISRLRRYPWPGNIRELKNLAERLVIMSGERIQESDVPDYLDGSDSSPPPAAAKTASGRSLKDLREEVERDYIRRTLEEYGWNVTKAAQALGIERTNLHKKMKQLDIRRSDDTAEP